MVSKPVIKPAYMTDVDELMANIRPADLAEIYATTGDDPRKSVEHGIKHGVPALTARVDGQILCIFGVTPVDSSVLTGSYGVPWLIGTTLMERHEFVFIRENRRQFRQFMDLYQLLVNYVDDRHDAAKRWLRWLGFTLEAPEPYGHAGLPFRRFYMDTNTVRKNRRYV